MTLARRLLPPLFACLFMPTLALADARSGPYVVGGLTLDLVTASEVSSSAALFDSSEARLKLGESRTGGTVAAGYQFALGSQFILMVEAGKDIGTDLQTSFFDRRGSLFGSTDQTRSWQLRRDWHVALKPGWQVSPSTTLYLSIAHHRGSARLDKREDSFCDDSGCLFTEEESFMSRMDGTGFGLGIQSALSEHWFLRAEVERIDFGRVEFTRGDAGDITSDYALNRLDARNTVGRVMIGWRF